MTYHIVCHRHFFYLYRLDSNEITLIASERHWEPLIGILVERKVKSIHLFDNLQSHNLKIETATRSLRLYEYAQWCWQKWCHVRQNTLFATVRPLKNLNSILIASSPSTLPLMPMLEKLDQSAIAATMISYPLALILRIQEQYGSQWVGSTPPLLVIIDRESHVFLAFFQKSKLVFIRQHTLATAQDIQGTIPKNILMDTVRYLEKTLNIAGISPVFFLENNSLESTFRDLFPNCLFYLTNQNEIFEHTPLTSNTTVQHPVEARSLSGPIFDRCVLKKIPRMSIMHLQRGILQGSWVRILVPYIRMINIIAIISSIYGIYTSWNLMKENQKLVLQLSDIETEMKSIQAQISAIPISSQSIPYIQSIWADSHKQNQQTARYWTLLEHLLMDRCLVRSIAMNPNKTKIYLRIIDPTLSMDDLMDMGKNAFPLFNVHPPKNPKSGLFILELNSPFCYEKTAD